MVYLLGMEILESIMYNVKMEFFFLGRGVIWGFYGSWFFLLKLLVFMSFGNLYFSCNFILDIKLNFKIVVKV